jgi:tRNA threonylcarbamoyladenosine dehydratase
MQKHSAEDLATRAEIAESLKVRTRQGTPTEKLEIIMTAAGLDRLEAATVMVIGLGGVGSNCVEALARGGVGHLVVIDHDVVSESNINRQAIAYHSTLGRKKHEVVRDMVADINPACEVEAIDAFLRAEDIPPLFDRYLGKVDMVIDAIDSVSTKLAIAEYADRNGMPLISSMGGGNKLHPEMLRFADVSKTKNCPLSRVMRKECRKRGIRKLRVLYSCEEPVKRPAVEGASRRERTNLGTASFIPPIMGQMLAGKVLCEIAQVPEA